MELLLKGKSNLGGVMLGLIKNLKIMFNMQVQYMCCDTAGENVALKSMQIGRAGVRL